MGAMTITEGSSPTGPLTTTIYRERIEENHNHRDDNPTAPLSPKPPLPSSFTTTNNADASNSMAIVVNRVTLEELAVAAKPGAPETRFSVADVLGVPMEVGGTDGEGKEGRVRGGVSPIIRRFNREKVLRGAGFVSRICGAAFSLVSFSVMAADKTEGWSGDSFYRYKEYRYLISVTVIAFLYSGFQVIRRIHKFATRKAVSRRPSSLYIDFASDQVLAYLLISAASSAASLTDDTVSEWGGDPFTNMACGSVGMVFLAFAALALSSLISGYLVYNQNNLW